MSIVLNENVLAYCGYKLEGNKIIPTYYEPNPYTPIEVVKEHIKQFESELVPAFRLEPFLLSFR